MKCTQNELFCRERAMQCTESIYTVGMRIYDGYEKQSNWQIVYNSNGESADKTA